MRVQRLKSLMLGVLMLSLGMFGFARADLAGYIIDQYQADFVLQSDGILAVEEDIEVYFWEQRHGIYRDIPIWHQTDKDHQIQTPIEEVFVDGKLFSTSQDEGLFRIKIGSPDFKVS